MNPSVQMTNIFLHHSSSLGSAPPSVLDRDLMASLSLFLYIYPTICSRRPSLHCFKLLEVLSDSLHNFDLIKLRL